MKELGPITDPVYRKKELNAFDRFFLRFIRDEKDLPFAYLTLQICLTMLPVGILLYFVNGWLFWIGSIVYFVLNNFIYKGSFGLMLHCTSHRPLYKTRYKWMNNILPWFVGPFFGQSPETYFCHHIGMHHLENNLDDDDSSTMPYQRDSFRGWMHYFLSFLFLGLVNVSRYFTRKKRNKLRMRFIRGEFTFVVFCVLMSLISFKATLMVFILPFVISRIIMMVGNWAQHAFIDPTDPENLYKSSITCINTGYNHKCWNDGYHISHHLKPSMHYTGHPGHFLENLDKYKENDAIIFDGIHFLHVWLWLMIKRYDLLASHFVDINDRFQSDEEVMAFLRSRTQPISFLSHAKAA